MASTKPRRIAAVVWLVAFIGVVDSRAALAQDTVDAFAPRTVLAAVEAEARPLEVGTVARPAPLLGLYVSLAGLQALDIVSTRQALNAGAVEANPVVAPFAGSPVAFAVIKAGVTSASIVASERLWKKNRKAALLTMIALNAAYGIVVAHNYRVAAAQR
jgi:ABC-type uncharacterized transport system permease subunit